jgi:hypothetical protein
MGSIQGEESSRGVATAAAEGGSAIGEDKDFGELTFRGLFPNGWNGWYRPA